ncbi:TonB C-terminal domain-containing protein [Pseudothauera rhizosphaerae]|uniref:TonB C-terminal domain-containing protein n=1 Tax=Pseudothauera rhizosphaerae TaxID=2565932 RepID=UPI001454C5F3|nr:TonB C-terminal domain-containing protein [Pseudothauera rhizosphaerae]
MPASSFSEDDTQFDFDIPTQPLEAALDRYAQATGRPTLLPSDLLGGRTSSPVRGRYSAEVGLQMLLQGSGLAAARRRSRLGQTFVLQQAEVAVGRRSGLAALFGEAGYAGLLQARIWQSLCADARTRPADYSVLLRFLPGTDGRLYDVRLLGSSGDAERDAALLGALQRVRIERAPPPAIARQALTMMIRSNDSANGPRCEEQRERTGNG